MISVTPSVIIEYLYCRRYTYFEYVLGIPQNEEKYYKVLKGRELHEKKLTENRDYIRKRIGAVSKDVNVYLSVGFLRGVVDEILELKDGTMAPLDYKYAEWSEIVYETYKIQMYCYAYMIEQIYGKHVEKGYLVFVRSKNKLVEVAVNETSKNMIKESIIGIYEIVEKNFYPSGTKYKKKCYICTYRNICTM